MEVPSLAREFLPRCSFPPSGTEVTCAVSGGADSLALLVLAVEAGCAVTAVHVDHGLRDESADEADVVSAAAERFGTAFRAERSFVESGPNLEARARTARYAVLPEGVLTGHTADDQAETVLLNILRGSGLEGIAAMGSDERRPILGLRRNETRALCAVLGLEPVVDASNIDPTFRRNRVRHELLPLMDNIADRDVAVLLNRLADLARDANVFLAALATGIDSEDAKAVATAPTVLARIAVREWLRGCSADRHPPDAATVERVLAVARCDAKATEIGDGWRIARTEGRLRLERR